MRVFLLFFSFIALLSLFGAGVYYTSTVSLLSLSIALLCASIGTYALSRMPFPVYAPSAPMLGLWGDVFPRVHTGVALASIALCGVVLVFARMYATTSAVRSPWLVFSPAFLLLLGVGFFGVLLFSSSRLTALAGAACSFCASTLAVVLFPLGFGFDPFLHRAALTHILTTGSITPKPWYYIGAYALELFGVLFARIPLFFVDVLLAPSILAALFLFAFRFHILVLPVLAFFPFSAFVSSTPHAVALCFALATILTVRSVHMSSYQETPQLPYQETPQRGVSTIIVLVLAFATLITHPLVGIPTFFFVAFFLCGSLHSRIRTLVTSLLLFLGSLAIPLSFLVQTYLGSADAGFSFAGFSTLSRIPSLGFFTLHGNPLLDTIMLFGGNLFLISALLACWVFFTAPKEIRRTFLPYALTACVTFLNFIVLSLGFDFPFVLSYERTDFALRLLPLTTLFLLPLISDGCARIFSAPYFSSRRGGFVCVCALWTLFFCANIYVSYPRHDGYTRSAGFTVSAADQAMVQQIADDAQEAPYIVLGNQMLSVSAVEAFGFFAYYNTLFAYPIPTSGPLYPFFLAMVEQMPTRETVERVKALTGVSRIYVAIHAYWWDAAKRTQELTDIADYCFSSPDGSITTCAFLLPE